MSFLDDLPVWGKLYLIIGVFILGMILITTLSTVHLNTVGSTMTNIHAHDDVEVVLLELKQGLQQARQTQITALVPQYQSGIEELYARYEQSMIRLKSQFADFAEQTPVVNQEETELRDMFRKEIAKYDEKMIQIWSMVTDPNKADAVFNLIAETRTNANAADQALSDLLNLRQESNQQLYDKAINDKDNGIRWLVLVAAVSVGFGFLVSHYIVQNMSTRLGKLAVAAEDLATGNLIAFEDSVSGKDEIGNLARAFEVMRDNLRDLVGQVVQVAREISGSSQQLAASAQETSGAANQSASTAQQFAANTLQLSHSAQSVAAAAKQSVDGSKGAQRQMEQAVELMHVIQDTARYSTESVDELSDNANRIHEITELIRKIAEQTNLLALNAAIEAARAGEHGRGFAVVADEVGKLAKQSRKSAEEIANLLQTISSQAYTASTNSRQSVDKLDEGVQTVQKINRLFAEVASASEEATRSIHDISGAAQEMAAGSQEIAVSAERQSSAIEQISGLSQSLAALGEQLHNVVGWFSL
ncbi:MAG: methyl-accepting chemotaxis protein [Limnochordia bacterium]|nr:methyl-accepting chemotaxis protein [Limnochordia bacterium]MDD2629337.1 methyl-accepting chemotaxis protein [Limnochordia bacterium]